MCFNLYYFYYSEVIIQKVPAASADVFGGLQRVVLDAVDLVLLRGHQVRELREQVAHLGERRLHARQLRVPRLHVAEQPPRLSRLRLHLLSRTIPMLSSTWVQLFHATIVVYSIR